jgi:hypothetical protein
MTQLQLVIFFWFGIGDSTQQKGGRSCDYAFFIQLSCRISGAGGKSEKGEKGKIISDCGMTDRGCLPAIASPPGIARLQPRRTGRSGEAGGSALRNEKAGAVACPTGFLLLATDYLPSALCQTRAKIFRPQVP